jgi:hypothetical protein
MWILTNGEPSEMMDSEDGVYRRQEICVNQDTDKNFILGS